MTLIRVLLALTGVLAYGQGSRTDRFNFEEHYSKREVRIAMRDGVRLFAAIYSPKDTSTKYPILLMRTPYGVDPYGANAYPTTPEPPVEFAQEGFILVYEDVRGRFESEGEFVEMRPEHDRTAGTKDVDESTDTYDTIDWLIKNVPNNNGKAGLVGTSYPGFYTSAGLINAHPALVAASPEAPIADLYMGDDSYHNGAFFLIANFSFYREFGKQNNPELPHQESAFPYGTNDGYEFYLHMGAGANSNKEYFKYKTPYWTETISHPNYD